MSVRFDWYKHDPHAFLIGVQGMGPDVIGAYIVILDLIYARGGEMRRDDHHLSGILGCSKRLAKSLTDRLIEAGKISFDGDLLTNFRAETELNQQRMVSERRSNAQRVRRENESVCNENNDIKDKRISLKPSREEERRSIKKDLLSEDTKKDGKQVEEKASKTDPFRDTLSPVMRSDILDDFCKHRRTKKAAFTATAAKMFLQNAADCGMSPDKAAVTAIDRNWITVKPEWVGRGSSPRGSPNGRKRNYVDAVRDLIGEKDDEQASIFGNRGDAQRLPARLNGPGSFPPDD